MISDVPERKIEMVHLQLTSRCNLNCWFCGQKKKDWSKIKSEELSTEEWLEIVQWLEEYSVMNGVKPVIMIWGGEAMLSSAFEPVVKRLYTGNFKLGMVTNGTLFEKNLDLINECFQKIYISVDGNEEVHDAIRGKGVYRKIQKNLSMLETGSPQKILMTVLTDSVISHLKEILLGFQDLNPDGVILQDMIFMEEKEIKSYKKWLWEDFAIYGKDIDAWFGTEEDRRQRDEIGRRCREELKKIKLPYKIQYLPHISVRDENYCLSPFRHVHLTWNGQMSFCTDYTDFSCGSVRRESPDILFLNNRAEAFRKAVMEGKCVACEHCSWRYRENFSEL